MTRLGCQWNRQPIAALLLPVAEGPRALAKAKAISSTKWDDTHPEQLWKMDTRGALHLGTEAQTATLLSRLVLEGSQPDSYRSGCHVLEDLPQGAKVVELRGLKKSGELVAA